MSEKSTNELEDILGTTHPDGFDSYCKKHSDSMNLSSYSFQDYIKELLKSKGITQQVLFVRADIPERYGYKLLSGEKHTKQRDIILRICYCAELSLQETQRALKKYQMPELYAKIPRDALLMIAFNERPGSIIAVNELLRKHGMEALRTSGIQN